jgi:hypothetical protein
MQLQMQAKDIQLAFLDRVKSVLPRNLSLAEELSELLGTSIDSTYRRMRGDTLLSIDEIAKICGYFKVSLDSTASAVISNTVTFKYLSIGESEDNFKLWLSILLGDVIKISQSKDSNIIYAADDVPIWHHFYNDKLTAFKIFYWLKSIMNTPTYRDLKFNINHIHPNYLQQARELLAYYDKTNSTEIWSEDTLNSTLKQIEYFWESGFFESKEDAKEICDLVEESIRVLQRKCENGSKTKDGKDKNFKFYHCEVMIGNNSILVFMDGQKLAYVSNNTFNMMSTSTPEFVCENERWLQNLSRKSILISGVSEKQRNQYFMVLYNKIEKLKKLITEAHSNLG